MFGGMLVSVAFQYYLYLTSRIVIHAEALIAQLVLEDSLRPLDHLRLLEFALEGRSEGTLERNGRKGAVLALSTLSLSMPVAVHYHK